MPEDAQFDNKRGMIFSVLLMHADPKTDLSKSREITEHRFHTRGVIGSIPIPPTIELFERALAAQLPIRPPPMRAMPGSTVRQALAEGVARPAQAAPPLQQFRIALADGTAGAGVGARVLQLTCFGQPSGGCRARSCHHDRSSDRQYQSMHSHTSGSLVVGALSWVLAA